MKLQRGLTRVYNGKKFFRYFIYIPEDHIQRLGWKPGLELVISENKKYLVVGRPEDVSNG